jgi:hypothetical protein
MLADLIAADTANQRQLGGAHTKAKNPTSLWQREMIS